MSRLRGSLQELANPGSEFTWATFAFAGNDPQWNTVPAVSPTWRLQRLHW